MFYCWFTGDSTDDSVGYGDIYIEDEDSLVLESGSVVAFAGDVVDSSIYSDDLYVGDEDGVLLKSSILGESSPVVEDNLRLDSDKNDVFAGDMEGLLLESSIMGESSPILEDNLCLDSDQSVSEATTRLFRVGDVYVLSELRELTRSFGVKWYFITTHMGAIFVYNRASPPVAYKRKGIKKYIVHTLWLWVDYKVTFCN